MEVLFKIHIAA